MAAASSWFSSPSPPANPACLFHNGLPVFIHDTVEIPLQSLGTWLMRRSLPGVCAPELEPKDWGRLLNLYCKTTVSVWVMFLFLLVLSQLICCLLPIAGSVSPHALLGITPICYLLPNSPDWWFRSSLSLGKSPPGSFLTPFSRLGVSQSTCLLASPPIVLQTRTCWSCVLQELVFVIFCLQVLEIHYHLYLPILRIVTFVSGMFCKR